MRKPRMCRLCRVRTATVPDRDRPGRMTPAICGECHAERLGQDFLGVVEVATRQSPEPRP